MPDSTTDAVWTALMVFIRPTILRDGLQAATETNAKYNVLRNQQLARKKGRVTLLPGQRQPLLPPIEDLSKYADPTAGAQAPTPGTEKPPVETRPLEDPQQPQPQPQQPQQTLPRSGSPDRPIDLRPQQQQ